MKPRVLMLAMAALVIAGLVHWRLHRESQQSSGTAGHKEQRQLAPRFELYDHHSQLMKFERYLGRTEILVVFFDGTGAIEDDPLLSRLQDEYADLESTRLEVVAISTATPQVIRGAEQRTGQDYPFPVVTDIDLKSPVPVPVHRQWGLADEGSAKTRTAVFFVDRRGMVAVRDGRPQPLSNPESFIADRLRHLR